MKLNKFIYVSILMLVGCVEDQSQVKNDVQNLEKGKDDIKI